MFDHSILRLANDPHLGRRAREEAPITNDGSHLMLTGLILVCSLAVAPDISNCTRANAVHVLRMPAVFASPATCFMHGQAYLAETTIGRDLAQDERVKVICVQTRSVTAADVMGPQPATSH